MSATLPFITADNADIAEQIWRHCRNFGYVIALGSGGASERVFYYPGTSCSGLVCLSDRACFCLVMCLSFRTEAVTGNTGDSCHHDVRHRHAAATRPISLSHDGYRKLFGIQAGREQTDWHLSPVSKSQSRRPDNRDTVQGCYYSVAITVLHVLQFFAEEQQNPTRPHDRDDLHRKLWRLPTHGVGKARRYSTAVCPNASPVPSLNSLAEVTPAFKNAHPAASDRPSSWASSWLALSLFTFHDQLYETCFNNVVTAFTAGTGTNK